jgi:hypothetical protein
MAQKDEVVFAAQDDAFSETQAIRIAAGLSITAAAALADVAPHTWKVFELNENAVRDRKKREECKVARTKMAELAKTRAA